MKIIRRHFWTISLVFLLSGCASFFRSCSNWNAESFGSDWVVVQFNMEGHAFNCWKLRNVSITNEHGSDGIYWQDTKSGHLVHISGWYNRVQVTGGDYLEAARLVGVDVNKCGNGKYPSDI